MDTRGNDGFSVNDYQRAFSMTDKIHSEDEYSSFYKAQLRLLLHDDYASVEGSVHRYADHIHRKLAIANDAGVLSEFEEHWFYRDDGTQPPFRGANLRTFFQRGSDPDPVIWKVFDLYMKRTQPLLVKACKMENYLQRLGFTLSEFIHPVPSAKPPKLKQSGLFAHTETDGEVLYLDVQRLRDRHYALAHLVHTNLPNEDDQINIEGLTDQRTRIDKGVCIPQTQNDLIMIRDIETADVSFGFLSASGDDICCHHVGLGGSVETLIFSPCQNEDVSMLIKAASFKEEDNQ